MTNRRGSHPVAVLLLLAFTAGDILFGDRAEVWEHATFLALVLLSHQLLFGRRGAPGG